MGILNEIKILLESWDEAARAPINRAAKIDLKAMRTPSAKLKVGKAAHALGVVAKRKSFKKAISPIIGGGLLIAGATAAKHALTSN